MVMNRRMRRRREVLTTKQVAAKRSAYYKRTKARKIAEAKSHIEYHKSELARWRLVLKGIKGRKKAKRQM